MAVTIKKTELGPEKKCARCLDFWPATSEFFYKHGDGLHSYCKACHAERLKELRAGFPRKKIRTKGQPMKQLRVIFGRETTEYAVAKITVPSLCDDSEIICAARLREQLGHIRYRPNGYPSNLRIVEVADDEKGESILLDVPLEDSHQQIPQTCAESWTVEPHPDGYGAFIIHEARQEETSWVDEGYEFSEEEGDRRGKISEANRNGNSSLISRTPKMYKLLKEIDARLLKGESLPLTHVLREQIRLVISLD